MDSSFKLPYNKPPLPLNKQVELLESRGVIVSDHNEAARFLGRVNYYRFVGYGLVFEEFGEDGSRLDKYAAGTRFEHIQQLCEFDSQLRILLWKYIEPIEVAFRTAICLVMSNETTDPFWFLNSSIFSDQAGMTDFLKDCDHEFGRNKPEVFIQAYKDKYSDVDLPPCWMLIEIVPFGSWSRAFGLINQKTYTRMIAGHLGTHERYLKSWIRSLVVVRNLCAHHLRLWNRTLPLPPELTDSMKLKVSNHQKLGAAIVVLAELLKGIGMDANFQQELENLLGQYPSIRRMDLGLQ